MQIASSVLIKNICCEVVGILTNIKKSITNSALQPDTVRGVWCDFLVVFTVLQTHKAFRYLTILSPEKTNKKRRIGTQKNLLYSFAYNLPEIYS